MVQAFYLQEAFQTASSEDSSETEKFCRIKRRTEYFSGQASASLYVGVGVEVWNPIPDF